MRHLIEKMMDEKEFNLHPKQTSAAIAPTRRQFLLSAVAGVFTVSATPLLSGTANATSPDQPTINPVAQDFLRIDSDGIVTVIAKHFEMGQGTTTGLPTIVAEELDADWSKVRVEWAPADATRYNNIFWGPVQGTGGSTATANSWAQLRQAGAIAREALMSAAAEKTNLPLSEMTCQNGYVIHQASNTKIGYGDLVMEAGAQKPSLEPRLKEPSEFRLIGRHIPRKDSAAKTDGTAIFSQDVKLPGMLKAAVARSPRFGGVLKSYDDTAARAVPGVVNVVQISNGVAVIAKDTWAAFQGRDALEVVWDDSAAEMRSSETMMADYKAIAQKPGLMARNDGDVSITDGSKDRFEATFEFPYLAHAPMEPLNAVAQIKDGKVDIWNASQIPTIDQGTAAYVAGVDPSMVTIHTTYAGGSFGRRATPNSDYVAEVVEVAKAHGTDAPIHVVWSREDDIKGGRYRPAYIHKVDASIAEDGSPLTWQQTIVGQSILAGTPFEPFLVKEGIDLTSVEGASDSKYAIPNMQVSLHSPTTPVTALWWRAVGHTHTAFVAEVTIDALARAAGEDALDYRLKLLKGHKRHEDVLNLLKAKSDWGKPTKEGHARGIALHESFGSVVGHVIEISQDEDGYIKLEKVTSAADVGLALNPDVVRAQIEGGLAFGLGMAMTMKLNLVDGIVEEENYPDFEPLRLRQMPEVDVHIVESSVPSPTGVGEPGTPPIAPALVNAIAALTGTYHSRLPLSENGVEFV